MSQELFRSIPESAKVSFQQMSSLIRLANNSSIGVIGTAKISMDVFQGKRVIEVYVLQNTSCPLILGKGYLHKEKIMLDYSDGTYNFRSVKVVSGKRFILQPNTETIVWGKLPDFVSGGLNGICSNAKHLLGKGLMVCKTLVTVQLNRKVPVRILNTTPNPITVHRGKTIAEFEIITSNHTCIAFPAENRPIVQHVTLNEKGPDTSISVPREQIRKIQEEFDISDRLNDSERDKIAECIFKNKDIFVTEDNPALGFTTVVEHNISLKDNFVGKHQKPYRLPPQKREVLRHHLDNLLQQGIISPVQETDDLPITSPVVLVSKRMNSTDKSSPQNFRFVCDFRHLNSQTKDFRYTIPNLQELTESFSDSTPNYLTSIDLTSGFFQMGLNKESSRYTAFNTCFGTYQFLRLPMGLKTSPNTFQLLMDKVLHGLQFNTCLCYLDDVLVYSSTFDQHIADLNEVFRRFREAGLKLGPRKCKFAADSCVFLGHQISKDGISPPSDRVDAVLNVPPPRTVKELRRIIGMFNWFRKFIPNFSSIINPLTRLLRKNARFCWLDDQQSAFTTLKQRLTSAPILQFPKYEWPFRLAVDTSSLGIGYMLYQVDPRDPESKPRIIRYGSKSLNSWQQSYGPTKLELLGMVVSILECNDYLRGTKFTVECDHKALQPLFQKQFKGAIYERWLSLLQQFNFDIEYKAASEMQLPDALSRCPEVAAQLSESPAEDDPYFPFVTESLGKITLPDGADLKDYISSEQNVEEQNSKQIVQIPISEPVAQAVQVDHAYDADTDETPEITTDRNKQFTKQKERQQLQVGMDPMQNMANSTIFCKLGLKGTNISALQAEDNELKHFIAYLKDDKLPDSNKKARRLLIEISDYVLVENILYHSVKQNKQRTAGINKYQLVVPGSLIDTILRIAHDSPMGGHCGVQNTLDRLKEFFYFPRMGKVISDYVLSCHECQVRKFSNIKTRAKITAFPTPCEPFEAWEIDLYGPLPISPSGNIYIFTAVDMLSKLLFTVPIRNKDVLTVSNALFLLFCQYGVCQTVISDQGKEFIGKCTKYVCKMLGVNQDFAPSFIHHCMGAVERTHRTLAERLTPFVQKGKQWEDLLPAIVFSMNSCVNSSSNYSPYEVIYGRRPNFPLTNLLPNITFKGLPSSIHAYLTELTGRLKIIRDTVKDNLEISKSKMLANKNQKINEIEIKVGDYVYMDDIPTGQGRKLKPIFSGPYVVHEKVSDHLIKLRDPTGKKTLSQPVHINRLKFAHIRQPNPQHFFENANKSESSSASELTDSEITSAVSDGAEKIENNETNVTHRRRSRRTVKKPIRFRDDNHVDPDSITKAESGKDDQLKIKRILAKKRQDNSFVYLVQRVGEPSQNAIWCSLKDLPLKAQDLLLARPPPLID